MNKPGSMHKGLQWCSLVFLLVVSAVLLLKAGYNRWQPATYTLTLTERELPLPYSYSYSRENSGTQLQLQWSTPQQQDDDWWRHSRFLHLPEAHFASFDFPACAEPYRYANRGRQGWVLLELNGFAYQEILAGLTKALQAHEQDAEARTKDEKEWQQQLKSRQERLQRAEQQDSRLFVVDAAAQRQLLADTMAGLRSKNPAASYWILPAEISDSYGRCDKKSPRAHEVQVKNLQVGHVHLPSQYARLLPQHRDPQGSLRYQVDLAYGRLLEPWVQQLRVVQP